MKLKNISVGDSVQLKKRLVSNIFRKKQVCEVIKIDSEHEFRPDVLVKGEYCLSWVNHKDLKKPIQCEPEPKLKVLDQSVFDHPYATDRFKYVALNADGQAVFFESKPVISNCLDIWVVHTGSVMPMLNGYDATNWQNSLIERKELTGSDLCRAMLARGDKYVSGFGHHHSDAAALDNKFADTVSKHTQCFQSSQNAWDYFVPINNQGEPLTAAEAGL